MRMAAYCRVSTDEERQLDSLAHQKTFFIEFAESHGHELYAVFADEGISGKQLKRRDAFYHMMQDADKHRFELLVVKDVSRFARNTVDLLTAVRRLKLLGIEVLFLSNNQRILGESEFILTIFGAMAQEESANLSKRVKFGKNITAKQGRVPTRIFGYDRVDNFHLCINPEEAETVQKIYDLYLDQGLGYRKIAACLNQEGSRTKYGLDWNPRAVRRILVNPIYCGNFENHKYEITDFLEGTMRAIPAQEHYWHDRPEWAIVTPEQFQQVQSVMEKRRGQLSQAHRQGRHSTKHLFSTLIRCKHCGRSFSRKQYTYAKTRIYWKCTTNDQYTSHRCPNCVTVDESTLKNKLSQVLCEIVGDREVFAKQLAEEYQKAAKAAPNSQPGRLAEKRMQLNRKRQKYRDLYTNDLLTLEELKQKDKAIAEQVSLLDLQITGLKQEKNDMITGQTLPSMAREELNLFLSLEQLSNTDLRCILSQIIVGPDGAVQLFLRAGADSCSENRP